MKKTLSAWFIVSAIVMVGFPWLAVTFVKPDGGMSITLLLFYIVNPLYTIYSGVFAGTDIRNRWFFPIILAVLFVIGTWLSFESGADSFVLYACVYLIIGFAAMIGCYAVLFLRKKQSK